MEKLRELRGDFELEGDKLIKYQGSEAELMIPEGVREIGENAFIGNESLEKVIFPQGLSMIGKGAFSGCKKLKSVSFPEGLKSIDECAFYMCKLQGELILPDSVRYVGHMAFSGNYITEVRAKGLGSISSCAFFNCNYITKLSFSEKLTRIGASAFCGANRLKELYLPESVVEIGWMAFAGAGLEKLHLPSRFKHELNSLEDAFYFGDLKELSIGEEQIIKEGKLLPRYKLMFRMSGMCPLCFKKKHKGPCDKN